MSALRHRNLSGPAESGRRSLQRWFPWLVVAMTFAVLCFEGHRRYEAAEAIPAGADRTNGFSRVTATNTLNLPDFQVATGREYLQSLAQALPAELGTNADALFTRAQLTSHLGDQQKAEAEARQALALQTNRADIAVFLAHMLIREDRMPEAAELLERAVAVDPEVKGGQRHLGMVLDRLGKPTEAEAAFQAAIKADPKDAEARMLLGRFLLDHGQLPEAVTDLEEACRLDPGLANAYYPLFQAQTRLGHKEAAQKALQKFKELKKDEKTGMGTLYDAAYDNEAELRSYTAGLHTQIGNALRHGGKSVLAEAHYLRATEIAPGEVKAFEALGDLYLQEGRLAEARKPLEKVAELRPNDAWPHINLGTLLLQLRDAPAGVRELKRALELDPKQAQALYNLSRYYLSTRQDLAEALALAKRLTAAEPSGISYDLLGWAYYANGRTNEALSALTEAVEKMPENPMLRQRLDRLRRLSGGEKH